MKRFKQFFENYAPGPAYFFHGGRDWDALDPNILSRIGKWKKDVSDDEIINAIKKLSAK